MGYQAENRTCQNCKQDFVIEPEDFSFYEKIQVPPPTFCPECRYQRRLANRNEWNYYKRSCSLCGKDMVSIYKPEYPGPVYCKPCYWSDKWDALDYGRDFNFNRSFFEQFQELRFSVPRVALTATNNKNSDYTNQSSYNKNCYIIVASDHNEDCLYGSWFQQSRECMDCWNIKKGELLYECLDCLKCYKSAWLETSSDCSECYFGQELHGCQNCFGCINLRNKSYCWFNEQLTREEYEKRFNFIVWTRESISENYEKMKLLAQKLPSRFYHGVNVSNFSGDYVGFSKNTHYAFNCFENENLKYSQDAWEALDCMDLTETTDNTLDYECEGTGWGERNIVVAKKWYGSDILYSELTFNSDDLFGCVSMIKKKYCIFNKQYSKEDYKRLKTQIIEHMRKTGEWGEFFPVEISPFAYNESMAQDYFPLTKEEVLERGFAWYKRKGRDYQPTLNHKDLPKTPDEISEDLLGEVINCASQDRENKNFYNSCTTAFRFHRDEFLIYKKLGLPLPDKCYRCRLQDRLARRNPRKLWHRQCMCDKENHFHGAGKCEVEFETSYAPDRPEIVYCEKCYQQEVY